MVGNSPLLPSNVNPLYDPSGNLVAFQQGAAAGNSPTSIIPTTAPTTAPTPTQVGATPNPPAASNPVKAVVTWVTRGRMGSPGPGPNIRSSPGGPVVGHVSWGSSVSPTGAAVSGPSNNPQTPGVANSTQWIPVQGGYVSAADVQRQQSSPAVQQSNTKTQTASNSGAGSESWQSRMRGLRTYTPQYGDNMNEVANKLGLKGGWQAFGVPSFEHGVPINIPAMPAMPAMPGMPSIQQNASGQSVSMPGINIHQSEQGQSVQVNDQQFSQQVPR